MARFYKIKIKNFWLSSDGSENGDLCKLEVFGVDALRKQFVKTVTRNFDGTAEVSVFDAAANKPLDISVINLPKAVGENLLTIFNNLETFTVVGTMGDTGDFTGTFEMIDIQFKEFKSGRWKNALIKLQTV